MNDMNIKFEITTEQRTAYAKEIIANVKLSSSGDALREELNKVLEDLIKMCN